MNLPFNWFDVAILVVLFVGVQRGRKQGMSEELLLVIKWLAIIFGCAFSYEMIGDTLAENSVFTHLASYTIAYLCLALVIAGFFLGIKKLAHGKLVGSDIFGSGEYYLGMAAGAIRYACILIFFLAFLNAPLYTKSEIQADLNYQNEAFGSDFFPKLYTIQSQVFEKSFLGPYIQKNLGFLLIKSTHSENKQVRHELKTDVPN